MSLRPPRDPPRDSLEWSRWARSQTVGDDSSLDEHIADSNAHADVISAHDASASAHAVVIAAHKAESDPHPQYTQNVGDELITGPWKFEDSITLSKTSGKGVKVDPSAPTFPWHDLLGAISIRGTGATDPSYNVYRGGIRGYQFDVNEEVFVEFHVPHDLVPGSDLFIHWHHSINGTTTAGAAAGTVTGGTVTWGAEVTYAKGHNQGAFVAPITTTATSDEYAATLYQHYITEIRLSAPSPSTTQLDSDLIEVDGLILVRAYLSANNITVSAGLKPAPFLHFVDIHYQSTGIGTKNKSPNFWT